jgi:hypothetical protein
VSHLPSRPGRLLASMPGMRRPLASLAALSILLWPAFGASPAHAGASPATSAAVRALNVGPNRNVTKSSGNQSEGTIAVNPTNTQNIVMVSNVPSASGLFRAYTLDGGATWTRGIIAAGGALGFACCDPSGAFDSFGNYFLTYLDSTATDVQAAISTDGGATFSFVGTIRRSVGAGELPAARSGSSVDQPSLAVGDGSVWFTYAQFSSQPGIEIRGLAVNGLGDIGALSAPELAPTSSQGNFGDVAVGPAGEVIIAYQDGIAGQGPAHIYVDVDPDGFGPMGFKPRVTVTGTNVGGFDYLPAQAGRSVDAEAGLAWDRSAGPHHGRIYLMYTDERVNESDDMNILLRYSDDGGTTWSAKVRVSDDRSRRSQILPRISLDQTTGNLAVTFYDCRNDSGSGAGDTDGIPNDDAQFWGTISKDGGVTFRRNFRISEGTSNSADAANGIDYGDYTGLDFTHGVFYPTWADNSNSTGDNPNGTLSKLDMYTAKVTVS